MLLDPYPSLLAPPRPPLDLHPQQRTSEEDDPRDERKAPPASHGIDHLDDDRRPRRAHQAPDEIVRRRRRRRARGIEIDQQDPHDVERARQRESDDEEEDQRHREMRFPLQRPPVTENRGDPGIQRRPDNLDAGELDREAAHVIAAFDVDFDADFLGDSFVVYIHHFPAHDRGYGATGSEGNER